MTLGDLIDEIMESLQADGLSPFPGFFTLAIIAKIVLSRGWEGKRQTSGETGLTDRQLLAIRRYLDDYYEVKRSGGHIYYGRNKRRQSLSTPGQ